MGGDEFLLFLPQANTEQAENTVSNVIEQFKEIIKDDSETHFAALSAGMLMCTRNDTFADAYSKADKALYYVKQMVRTTILGTTKSIMETQPTQA